MTDAETINIDQSTVERLLQLAYLLGRTDERTRKKMPRTEDIPRRISDHLSITKEKGPLDAR